MADLAARGAVGGRSGAAAAAVALGRMCVRTFGASAAAVPPRPGFIQGLVKWLKTRAAAVWPPPPGKYQYYVLVAGLTYVYLYFAHVRYVRTREAEEEDRRKREYALISMKHMVE